VIGGGAAGTCAAIEAGGAGLDTLVLDAASRPGGAAALSSGGVCAVDTPLQRRLGLADGVERALADWIAWGGADAVDVAWARRYVERSCADVYAWAAGHGVRWDAVFGDEGNSVARWHRAVGGGAQLMRRLRAATRGLPVRWRCETRAERLVAGGTGRAGVELASGERLWARAVVVATGGFTGSMAALRKLAPGTAAHASLLCGGGPQADGSGHALLAGVGAGFVGLDRVWSYPYGIGDDRDAAGRRGIAVREIPGEIWLNAHGRRFHDESRRGGATGTPAVLAQPGGACWALIDAGDAASLTLTDPFYGGDEAPDRGRIDAFLARSPDVHAADTVAGAARAAGLPEHAVGETVDELNGWLRAGRRTDPRFGRDLSGLRPIERPPFRALRLRPLARKCLGGVRTDLRCGVVDEDGARIAGVYAAGEVAGMAGGHINGRAALEGTMLGPSLLSGRIAGRAVAEDLR
jgi:predicted oxidoreductase